MKQDIIVLSPLGDRQMEDLGKRYNLLRADLADDLSDFVQKNGQNCRAVISTGHIVFDNRLISKLPRVELVTCVTAGFDQVNLKDLKDHNIRLTNTPDVLTDDVADVALMLMLAARRRLVIGDHYVRSGEWAKKGPMPLTETTAGKRAGIVGLGRIGHAIAKRFESCGLTIGYYGRHKKPDVAYQFFPSLVELAKWSDILVVAVTGGKETEKLISKEVIAALGNRGSLINISRGTVIDEDAMIKALQNKELETAGLDVYLNEPNINPAFYTLENAVLYPHHGSGTIETRDRMSDLVVENIDAFFANKTLPSEVEF